MTPTPITSGVSEESHKAFMRVLYAKGFAGNAYSEDLLREAISAAVNQVDLARTDAFDQATERQRYEAEEARCVARVLDDHGVPTNNSIGGYSLVGRVMEFARRSAAAPSDEAGVSKERMRCLRITKSFGEMANRAALSFEGTEKEVKWRAVQDVCADIADNICDGVSTNAPDAPAFAAAPSDGDVERVLLDMTNRAHAAAHAGCVAGWTPKEVLAFVEVFRETLGGRAHLLRAAKIAAEVGVACDEHIAMRHMIVQAIRKAAGQTASPDSQRKCDNCEQQTPDGIFCHRCGNRLITSALAAIPTRSDALEVSRARILDALDCQIKYCSNGQRHTTVVALYKEMGRPVP